MDAPTVQLEPTQPASQDGLPVTIDSHDSQTASEYVSVTCCLPTRL